MIKPSVMARRLRQIEAELPTINCKKLCQSYCGVIPMTHLEHERMEGVAGKIETTELPLPHGTFRVMMTGDGTCPMLRDGKCSVYEVRPMICRLWGLVEKLRCPHGCTPSRWISDEEAHAFLDRVLALSQKR